MLVLNMEKSMKKLLLIVVNIILVTINGAEHLTDLVENQNAQLYPIVFDYKMADPSPEAIETFLGHYPEGTSFQRVFSNQQTGNLCGVYAIQNALWYRYMMGSRDPLIVANKEFANFLNSVGDPTGSFLNGIEAEVFEQLLSPKFPESFGIIAFQQGQYIPLNTAGMTEFFGNGIGYVKGLISKKQIVSLLINCNQGDTYGTRGVAGHSVSVTMIQNKTKRVYLMADSLLDKKDSYDEGHVGFVLQFLNQVEQQLLTGKKIVIIPNEVAADYQIPSNNIHSERLRKEWLKQLSPDDIIIKFKKLCVEKLTGKQIDAHTQEIIFANIIDPALLDLDETATPRSIKEALEIVLKNGIIDAFSNAKTIYIVFDKIMAILLANFEETEKMQIQEQLEMYQIRLQNAINQKFVNADDIKIIDSGEENRGMKELIVTSYVFPVINKYIDETLALLVNDTCASFETCVNVETLTSAITKEINGGFDFVKSLYPLIQEDRYEIIAGMIMSIVGVVNGAEQAAIPAVQKRGILNFFGIQYSSLPRPLLAFLNYFDLRQSPQEVAPNPAASSQQKPDSMDDVD